MIFARNKKASFDYYFKQKIEAGIVLQGWEVKSIRAGKLQLVDSYVLVKDSEAFLLGSLIQPLSTITSQGLEPNRTRKLLLHSKEINKLRVAKEEKGFTIVCTQIHKKDHLIKAEIVIAQGKKLQDKRETIKKREWQREKQRGFKVDNQ